MKLNKQIVSFGDLAESSIEKVNRDNNPFKFYVEGGDMDSDCLILRRWKEFSDHYVGPSFEKIFKKGEILYGSRRTYLKKVSIAPIDGITSNTTFVVKSKVHPYFIDELLPYIMLSNKFTNHSVLHSKGSTNPYINWPDLAKFKIYLPDIDTQNQYLIKLKKMQAVYECTEALKTSLETLKKTIQHDFFVNNFSLVKARLGDLIDLEYGKSAINSKSETGLIPVVGTSGIIGTCEESLVNDETIIIGRKGTLGNPIYIDTPCWPIDTTFYAKKKVNINLEYLTYLLSFIDLTQFNEASGVPSLSRKTLQNISINIDMNINQQLKLVEIMRNLNLKKILLDDKQKNIRYISNTLCDELISK